MEPIIGFSDSVFPIALAIALRDALKQFLKDRLGNTGTDQEPKSVILWKRAPTELSFSSDHFTRERIDIFIEHTGRFSSSSRSADERS